MPETPPPAAPLSPPPSSDFAWILVWAVLLAAIPAGLAAWAVVASMAPRPVPLVGDTRPGRSAPAGSTGSDRVGPTSSSATGPGAAPGDAPAPADPVSTSVPGAGVAANARSGGLEAAPAPPTELEPASGVRLLLRPAAASAGSPPEGRRARLLALTVPAGTPFSSRFPPGAFHAEFRGEVTVDVRERYTFVVEGVGEAALEVNGKVAWQGAVRDGEPGQSEPVRLKKGANDIALRYDSPATGEARVRVLWASSEFKVEPIAPDALAHTPLAPEEAAARHGRALLQRLQCTACHADPAAAPATAPDLSGVGARLTPGFLYSWLLRPVRSGYAPRQMPSLFDDHADGRQQAADVAAYLATLRDDGSDGDAVVPADGRHGGELFAQLGCIGCHPRPGDVERERTGLDHVAGKWLATALVAYLRAPHAHDPGASMPDFRLTANEAAALAAFVRAGGAAPAAVPAGDIGRGRALVDRLGCAACHALPRAHTPPPPASPWAAVVGRIDGGGGDLCAGPPHYAGTASDAARLGAVALAPESLAQRADDLVQRLRCGACHTRDGVVDQWTQHAGEVGDLFAEPAPDPLHPEVAQTRPSLTWAGEKLRPDALRAVLAGTVEARARPWLRARMPGFPAHAETLARGLACQHGVSDAVVAPLARSNSDPAVADVAAIGAGLVSTTKFACVTCHGVGAQPPVQVFEVQGVNFAQVGQRLRPEFFLRWLRNPQRVDPSSKMPTYADARGRTPFTDVCGGDADRQFEAIWAWILTLK